MPTKAQKEAAAERRTKMRDLAARISQMTDAERQAMAEHAGTVRTIEGRPLSLHNTLMIAAQLHGCATVVGGFRQWKAAGRAVRQGQHGAAIWIPQSREPDPNLRDGEQTEDRTTFIMGTVFDISQTEETASQAQAAG